jgi:hypothetical protein
MTLVYLIVFVFYDPSCQSVQIHTKFLSNVIIALIFLCPRIFYFQKKYSILKVLFCPVRLRKYEKIHSFTKIELGSINLIHIV